MIASYTTFMLLPSSIFHLQALFSQHAMVWNIKSTISILSLLLLCSKNRMKKKEKNLLLLLEDFQHLGIQFCWRNHHLHITMQICPFSPQSLIASSGHRQYNCCFSCRMRRRGWRMAEKKKDSWKITPRSLGNCHGDFKKSH